MKNQIIRTSKIIGIIYSILFITLILANVTKAQEDIVTTPTNTIPESTIRSTVREQIRTDMDIRTQNLRNNQETRDPAIENPAKKVIIPKQQTIPINTKIGNKLPDNSTTTITRILEQNRATSSAIREGYLNDRKEMILKNLEERKKILHKQFEVALKNLTELRKRIGSRIEKDRLNGKDMSSVRPLLEIADNKISVAVQAVRELNSYTPQRIDISTTTVLSTTTQTVNLERIRSLVEKTRNSIKEAHKALVDVVVAIAKISGNPRNNNSTTTPSVSVTPIASTTPTVSPTPTESATPTASTTPESSIQ